MTNEEARKVLKGMGVTDLDGPNLFVRKGCVYASAHCDNWSYLSGEFTANQLEAIAMWMRDPAGVAGNSPAGGGT